MDDNTKTFGEAASKALTNVQASQGPSTTGSTTSNGSPEIEHKRLFLQTFRRWERLFRRKDGDVESDKWLIAEYYRALGHLTPRQLSLLTDELIKTHVFFPAIAECLQIINPPRYSYSSPFYGLTTAQRRGEIGSDEWWAAALPKPAEQIEYVDGDD